MIYAIPILCLLFLFIVCVPLSALAEMVDVTNQTPVHCGPKCVIETKAFSTHEEALAFADTHSGKVYKLNGALWMVDYQVTEEESELI